MDASSSAEDKPNEKWQLRQFQLGDLKNKLNDKAEEKKERELSYFSKTDSKFIITQRRFSHLQFQPWMILC